MIFFNTSTSQWQFYPLVSLAVIASDTETAVSQYGQTHESLMAGLRSPGMGVLRSEIRQVVPSLDQQARLVEINEANVPAQLQAIVSQYVEFGYIEQPKDNDNNVLSLGHATLDAIAARPEVIQNGHLYKVHRALSALAAYRWKKEIEGVVINGMTFGTTDREKALMGCKALASSFSPDEMVDYKSSEGYVQLTSTQMKNLFKAGERYVQACFTQEGVLSYLIKTAEDPLAVDITQGWPSRDVTVDLNA